MTVEKLKEIWKTALEDLSECNIDDSSNISVSVENTVNSAINRINMIIPKKPNIVTNMTVYKCPSCGEQLLDKRTRCPSCLQAIDWSEINDD